MDGCWLDFAFAEAEGLGKDGRGDGGDDLNYGSTHHSQPLGVRKR